MNHWFRENGALVIGLLAGCFVSALTATVWMQSNANADAAEMDVLYELSDVRWKEVIHKLEVERDVAIIRADVERKRWESLVDEWPVTAPIIPQLFLDDDELLVRYMRLGHE